MDIKPGGWYEVNGFSSRSWNPKVFYLYRRMRWKPWRWEVCERVYNGLDFSLVPIKRNLTKVSASGFVKLLSGE